MERKEKCLRHVDVYIHNLVVTKDELREHEKDYKTIQLRLEMALKLAKKYENLLTETQQKLINSKIPESPKKEVDWLPLRAPETMKTLTKDDKALNFYQKLSKENQQKFDDLQRMIFYHWFAEQKDKLIRSYTVDRQDKEEESLPKRPELLLFKDTENIESLISSRIAMLALKQQNFEVDDESLAAWRVIAIKQLDAEQNQSLGKKKVEEIEKGEVERRKAVRKWIARENGEEMD